MAMAPRHPVTTWECGICGKSNPGDIGFCPRCRTGSLHHEDTRPGGGLDHGAIPYFPVWHVQQHLHQQDQPPYEVHDGYLPRAEKYPHHKEGIQP